MFSKARVHSLIHSLDNLFTAAAFGFLPPHMAGLAARIPACFSNSDLTQLISLFLSPKFPTNVAKAVRLTGS